MPEGPVASGYVVDRVVICDAFREPNRHYRLLPGGRSRAVDGRRPSMRYRATARDTRGGIQGIVGREGALFEEMTAAEEEQNQEVNRLREEVREWREAGYQPGPALVTRRCLEWWFERDEERLKQGKRLFFCQQEAIETLVYLYEVQRQRRMPETGDIIRYALKLPEYLDSRYYRRRTWTGVVGEGRKCHLSKVPCHTDLEASFSRFLDAAPDVVRYIKNEFFGFSLTYYENNRPRQYFPDFIVLVRGSDGRETWWLAETKGEIRPNTPVKREAADLWCEKMSAAGSHGSWRHLFAPQRRFEQALAAGVKTFAGLSQALVKTPAEPQLRLVETEGARLAAEKFKSLLPVYSLKAAAGYFGSGEAVEAEGWVEVDGFGALNEAMFVARATGRSMEPRIHDGDYCVFRAKPTGTRQGKIVLAQYRGPADPETGGAFTIKRYRSEKVTDADGSWRHGRILLEPLNASYEPIVLSDRAEGAVRVIAEFLGVLKA